MVSFQSHHRIFLGTTIGSVVLGLAALFYSAAIRDVASSFATGCPAGYTYVSGTTDMCQSDADATLCRSASTGTAFQCPASVNQTTPTTTCPSGYVYSGLMCVPIATNCPAGTVWDGTSCVTSTVQQCDFTTQYMDMETGQCFPRSNCFDAAHPEYSTAECGGVRNASSGTSSGGAGTSNTTTTSGSTTCPSGTAWNGTACVANTSTATTPTCGSGLVWNGTACVTQTTEPTTQQSETTTQPTSASTVRVTWNSLGLWSYVSTLAKPSIIEAAKVACANTRPENVRWPNPSDFSKPDTAGIPDCSSTQATQTATNGYFKGVVVNQHQQPVVGAKVGAADTASGRFVTTTTSSTGSFAMPLLSGRWRVGVAADLALGITTAGEFDDIDVASGAVVTRTLVVNVAEMSGKIVGKIVTPAGATATDLSAFVSMKGSDGAWVGGASVTGGLFDAYVTPGVYELRLDLPANSSWAAQGSATVTVTSGAAANVSLVATKGGAKISGIVVGADGLALTGVPLSVIAAGENGARQEVTVTSSTGTFSIDVVPGLWYLKVISSSSAFVHDGPVSVRAEAGSATSVQLVMRASSATITGTVRGPSGTAAAGAWVMAVPRSSHDTAAMVTSGAGAFTAADGTFSIAVPAGTYTLRAYPPTGAKWLSAAEAVVTVTSAGTSTITLSFRTPDVTLSGRAVADRQPVPAFVHAWSDDGAFVETIAKEGSYSLLVRPGVWTIEGVFGADGVFYRSDRTAITVGPDGATHEVVLFSERPLAKPATSTVSTQTQTVVSTTDGARVHVPPALANAGVRTITVSPSAAATSQGSTAVVGVAYDVTATDSTGGSVTSLADDVTITLPYVAEDVTDRGATTQGMAMAYWDEAIGVWQTIATSVVNESEKTVSATVDHFTRFAIVAAADITPPQAPTAVTASAAATTSELTLSWENPTKDFSHVKIYRSTTAGDIGALRATDVVGETYVDSGTAGAKYYYTVRAVDPAGNESNNSNQVAAALSSSLQSSVYDYALAARLAGRILLQVEANGEAWYVHPITLVRHSLGRPAQALEVMRTTGLGITNADLNRISGAGKSSIATATARRVPGRILLQVEANGEAWYVHPITFVRHSLGRPAQALEVMRTTGLGITNADLAKIPVAEE